MTVPLLIIDDFGMRKLPLTAEFGRFRPNINASGYPPAPSARRATVKSEVMLRTARLLDR